MQGRYHLGLGLATGISIGIITANHELTPAICTAVSCCFGSIFPDIESATSKMGQTFRTASFIVRLFFSHRGLIHTPLFLVLLNIPLYILLHKYNLPIQLLVGFDLGYVLHLVQDSFTKRGINWIPEAIKELLPFGSRPSRSIFTIFKITSGKHSFLEFIISAGIFFLVTAAALTYAYVFKGITDFGITVNISQTIEQIKGILLAISAT